MANENAAATVPVGELICGDLAGYVEVKVMVPADKLVAMAKAIEKVLKKGGAGPAFGGGGGP
jgi:hypothetical protein